MAAAGLDDIDALVPSWVLSMRAARKSPGTIETYLAGIRRFQEWCRETGTTPVLDKRTVTGYIAACLETVEPTTAGNRLLALKRFTAWAADEDEIPSDPLAGMRQPKLDTKVIEPLSDDQLRDLLKTCAAKTFGDRRDEAIIRFMLETGSRASEVTGLALDDVDLAAGTAVIRRGKGGKGRIVPFGPVTALAIDRYLRMRRTHSLAAASQAVWLGVRGKEFGYSALYLTLTNRAKAAGIEKFHPHRLRHTAAHRWLAAGGSDSGLMAVAGWSQPQMLQRYTRARASERAAAEARSLNLGDL